MSEVIPARPASSGPAAPPPTLAHRPGPGRPAEGGDDGTSTIHRVRVFVGSHQLSVFTVLAAALAWWVWLLTPGGLNPTGPAIAAFIVVALSDGDPIKRFARQVLDVRTGPRWLVAAILVPIAVVVGAVAINTLFGAPAPTGTQLGLWTALPLEFLLVLVLIGFGEEIGWTAFAVPRALAGRSVLIAFVLLATMRSLWHLPLLLSGDMLPIEVLGMLSTVLLVLWVYRRSGGQWVPAAMFHAVNNTIGGSFLAQMVDGQDRVRLFVIQGSLYGLLALGTLVADRRRPAARGTDATAAHVRDVAR
jgi:membrane protease YdiL (CAAX protease family)